MGLSSILNVGSESLHNSQSAIEIAGHNIANAHTDGYSKQRVVINSKYPSVRNGVNYGTGARLDRVERAHDQYLERSLLNEVQLNSTLKIEKEGLKRIEEIFNPSLEGSIIHQMDAFAASVNELSLYPEELTIRTNVRGFGESLGHSFKQAHDMLETIRKDYDSMIENEVEMLNRILSEIADLNGKVQENENEVGATANDFRDKRDMMIRDLAERVDISWYENVNNEMIIRGPGSKLLVEGSSHGKFKAAPQKDNDAFTDIFFEDYGGSTQSNITSKIKSGSLKGMIEIRDKHAVEASNTIDHMAYTFSKDFNAAHKKGYGIGNYSGVTGRGFFRDIAEEKGAAGKIFLEDNVLADVNSIATGISPDSPGDNIIANQLAISLASNLFKDGTSDFNSFYSDQVGRIGVQANRADMLFENSDAVRKQLQTRKDSLVGVSLDEEAADLMKYQHMFAASSKIITTTDEMFETILTLKR